MLALLGRVRASAPRVLVNSVRALCPGPVHALALRPCLLPLASSSPGVAVSAHYSTSSPARQQQSGAAGVGAEDGSSAPAGEGGASSSSSPPGGESAPAGSDADAALAAAREENAKLKASVAELNGTRLRLLAEMENVRGIAKRDVDAAKAYALQGFAKRLLDAVDNLGRAVASVPPEMREKREGHEVMGHLFEGVSATHRSLIKTLGEFGIVGFGGVGDKFDPNRHEAMLQVPATAEVKAGHVAAVFKEGFVLKDRVIRPAQVSIATAADA